MRRDQLEHLIRAAGAILGESQVIVVGSQSIVGAVATVLPAAAVLSIEADLVPFDDDDGRKADLIDGTIGEGSMFEETHGIYADGVGLTTSRLPEGWRDRLRPFGASIRTTCARPSCSPTATRIGRSSRPS